ncbi:MAG: LLM class flavin-dependent oxidoreductase, partial [Alphaproteobacteria bacterium]|nr:LLM class flavin-dependent oxidoreductase [Alphaproteobacteria bacterium]
RFKKMREQVRTRSEPEYHGKIVEVPKRTWPKPIQKPHPPVIVGGAFPQSARRAIRYGDGWVPNASRPNYADVTEFVPQLKQMATEAGRVPATVPITIFGAAENLDRVKRYCAQSIARVVATLPAAPSAEILPILDRWAELISRIAV